MYETAFGLSKLPFSMTPDPAMVYMTAGHREALSGLMYSVLGRKGFTVLTGEVGTGKTTLIARMMLHLPAGSVKTSYIVTPTLNPNEFLELMLLNFGVRNIPDSKARRLMRLQEFLTTLDQGGQIPLVVVDEAHRLSPEVLEEIRLLGNFERPDRKLLQIVLVGQTELATVLNRQDMRQLKQRVATRLHITPMGAEETAPYIRFRWTMAGGQAPHPFMPDALAAITRVSRGIPRIINLLCDNSLMIAATGNHKSVNGAHVLEACEELDLVPGAAPVSKPPVQGAAVQRTETPPAEVPNSTIAVPFKTLQRYEEQTRKPSFFARYFTKLGPAS